MILKIILVNILVLACILSSAYIINWFLDRELEKGAKKSKEREASERPIIPPTIIHTKEGDIIPLCRRTIRVARAGSKVGSIGRHMKKHSRQSSQYRASVKRKIQPDDD